MMSYIVYTATNMLTLNKLTKHSVNLGKINNVFSEGEIHIHTRIKICGSFLVHTHPSSFRRSKE